MKILQALVLGTLLVAASAEAENGMMGSAIMSGAGQGLNNASSQMMSIYGADLLQQQQFRNQQLLLVQNEFRSLMSMKSQLDVYAALLKTRASEINKRENGPEIQAAIAAYNRDFSSFEAQVVAYNQRCDAYSKWKSSLGF